MRSLEFRLSETKLDTIEVRSFSSTSVANGQDQNTELDNPSDTQRLVNLIADERDAAIVTYTGSIDKVGFDGLVSELDLGLLSEAPSRRNILLVMTTYGGDANSAYKIARALQRSFESFHLYVPFFCKSAGTLVALGAKKLIMNQWPNSDRSMCNSPNGMKFTRSGRA